MTPADEIRADIETAKAEVKGIIERFTEKHGYMEITISASHNLQDIMNNKQVFRTHVSINAKL